MSDLINAQGVQAPAVTWVEGTSLPSNGGGVAMPLLVSNTTGRLMVDALTASEADLTLIENDLTTTNGLLTSAVADLAAIASNTSSGISGGSGASVAITTYACTTAFTGANVGDTITLAQVFGGSPLAVTSSLWYNQTQSAALASVPSASNLTLVGEGYLTNAQLRATAVPVSLASSPLPSGAATDASLTNGNQKTQVTSLPSIPAGSNAIGSVFVSNFPSSTTVTSSALPTGAATSALQPAINGDGGALAHVTNWPSSTTVTGTVNVQGGNSTAVKTDGSSVVQPVSGTVAVSSIPSVTGSVSVTNQPSSISINNTSASPVPVTIAGDTATVPVSGSVTATISGTPSVSVSNTPTVNIASGQTVGLAAGSNAIGSVSVSNFPTSTTITSSALPTGAATSSLQNTANSTLSSILSAVQAQVSLSTSVWADNTVNPPVYYVRNTTDNAGTITVSWTTPSGSAATPTVSNLVPIAGVQNLSIENQTFTATASGTGYSSGDVIIHAYGVDTAASTPAVAFSVWFNATSGAVLASAPSSSNLAAAVQPVSGTVAATQSGSWTTSITGTPTVSISGTVPVSASSLPLPFGAAQETGNLATLVTNTGHLTDGTQSTKIVSSGNTLALDSSGRPTVNVNGTIPVSLSSTPLPSGAALEAGNLATIASNTSGIATASAQSTGNTSLATIATNTNAGSAITGQSLGSGSGILGWLSSIYSKVASTLSASITNFPSTFAATQSGTWSTGRTWNLSSGSDSVTATISGTPSVTISGTPTIANTSFGVSSLPSIPAGTNSIGTVINGAGTASIGSTPPVQTSVSAYNGTLTASTSTAIISAGVLSKYLIIQNTSATTIYLAFGTTASQTNGLQIVASGGSFVMESNAIVSQSINLYATASATYVAWGA